MRAGARRAAGRPSGSPRRASTASDIEQILELVPIATHNQRGRGTLLVGTGHDLDAETLVDLVERSMSAPVFELLKRPDELFVVEHAHLQPRFVEDSVRVALKGLLDEVPGLDDDDFVLSRQVNLETIHDHDVLAERWGTVGELRAEMTGRRRAPDDARRLAHALVGSRRTSARRRGATAAREARLGAVEEPADVLPVQHDHRRARRRREDARSPTARRAAGRGAAAPTAVTSEASEA